jgi:hypothetical protein
MLFNHACCCVKCGQNLRRPHVGVGTGPFDYAPQVKIDWRLPADPALGGAADNCTVGRTWFGYTGRPSSSTLDLVAVYDDPAALVAADPIDWQPWTPGSTGAAPAWVLYYGLGGMDGVSFVDNGTTTGVDATVPSALGWRDIPTGIVQDETLGRVRGGNLNAQHIGAFGNWRSGSANRHTGVYLAAAFDTGLPAYIYTAASSVAGTRIVYGGQSAINIQTVLRGAIDTWTDEPTFKRSRIECCYECAPSGFDADPVGLTSPRSVDNPYLGSAATDFRERPSLSDHGDENVPMVFPPLGGMASASAAYPFAVSAVTPLW